MLELPRKKVNGKSFNINYALYKEMLKNSWLKQEPLKKNLIIGSDCEKWVRPRTLWPNMIKVYNTHNLYVYEILLTILKVMECLTKSALTSKLKLLQTSFVDSVAYSKNVAWFPRSICEKYPSIDYNRFEMAKII